MTNKLCKHSDKVFNQINSANINDTLSCCQSHHHHRCHHHFHHYHHHSKCQWESSPGEGVIDHGSHKVPQRFESSEESQSRPS